MTVRPMLCHECGKAIRSPKTDAAALVRVIVYTPGGLARWMFNFHRRCASPTSMSRVIAEVR